MSLQQFSVDNQLTKAKTFVKQGDFSRAKNIYETILLKYPRNIRAQKALKGLELEKFKTINSHNKKYVPEEVFDQIIKLYDFGKYEEVVKHTKRLINLYPKSYLLWNVDGAAHKALGEHNKASHAFKQVILLNPNFAEGYNNYGTIFKEQDKFDEALSCYYKALDLRPNYVEALNNIGTIFQEQGNFSQALDLYDKALKIKPDFIQAMFNKGIAFKENEKFDEAIKAYDEVLNIKPDLIEALFNKGVVLKLQGKLEEAKDTYNKAITLKPNYAEAHNNIGTIFKEQGYLKDALTAYEKALSIKHDSIQVMFNKAVVLNEMGFLDEAIESYNKILTKNPNHVLSYNNIGIILKEQGNTLEALKKFNMALKYEPEFIQSLYNIGVIHKQEEDLVRAEEIFKKVLSIQPKNARVIYNLGSIYNVKKNFPLAIEYYNDALALEPDLEIARAKKIHEQLGICDWSDIESEYKYLHQLGINKHHITPFSLLSIEDEPERHKKRSEIFSNHKYKQKALPFNVQVKEKNKLIRIGYFSSDFKTHPVAYLIAKVLEKHNRDRFKIYGYSINGNDEDNLRKRLMKTFDVFRDVKHKNDKEIALLAREDEIDIAIDLNGYTSNLRTRIFAYRAAPIQINFLGYPGTMGSDFMDYIIADHNLIPEKSQKFYSEKPIYLPYTYMPTDNTRQISLKVITRKEMDLPEKAFVFCCFNNNYKITPEEFDIWMCILSKVKNSVLWLRKSNEWSEINLRKEAKRRNVDPDRLIFAKKLPMEEHLARQKLADLFLDTFNFNAHTTASEALWAGLPVVTKMGSGFASRVAGSLLNAIDCPELITYSKVEYENLILALAQDTRKLKKIRKKIGINLLIKPLFDTELYTKNLENGFEQAYENRHKGKKIEVINVSEGKLK